MRKFYLLTLFMSLFTFITTNAQNWMVYEGNVLPSETEGQSLDISELSQDSPGAGFVESIMGDYEIAGNRIFKYFQPEEGGTKMYRYSFDETWTDSTFTIAFRAKGSGIDTIDRVFDVQWRNGNAGTRDELRISPVDSTIYFDRADTSVKVDADLNDWHVYRILVIGDSSVVFFDESEDPVLTGISGSSTSDTYIKVGDGSSSSKVAGYVDWLAIDTMGAYTAELSPLPQKLINPFAPWLAYNANVLPGNSGTLEELLDLTDISQGAPGDDFIEELMEDPDIPGNTILKYIQPTGVATKMYRWSFDDNWTDSTFTIMTRLKGAGIDTIDRVFDIQWRNGNAGTRDELRIWPNDSTLELEKAEVEVKVNLDLNEWHTYRIAVYGDSSAVYIDNADTATIAGISTSSTGDTYLKIGDGSSDNIAGYLDWFMIDTTEAYAPEEGTVPLTLVAPYYPWLSYNGSDLPENTGTYSNPLDLTDVSQGSPGDGFIEEVISDPKVPNNELLQYYQPDPVSTKMYRWSFDDNWTDSTFTMVARLKGSDVDTIDRVFDIQWRNGNAGTRDELRIWPNDSTIELEKAEVEVKVDMNLNDWHIYRVVVYGDSCAVFIDEATTPAITGVSESSSGDKYIKIGDGSSDAIGGFVDWFIIDTTMASAPEELGIPEVFPGIGPEPISDWYYYLADVLPDGNSPAFEESNVTGGTQTNTIIEDPDNTDNNLLELLVQPASSLFMWKYNFEEEPQDVLTMVARVKGVSDTIDRPIELDFRHGGFRERLFINSDNTFELKYAEVEGRLPNVMNWHTYRITKTGDQVSFYLDESPTPVAEVTTSQSDDSNYFRFGDGNSSRSIGGLVDYVIWNESGAYSPGELPLPEGLLKADTFSYDATLSALTTDVGTFAPEFDPAVTEYVLKVPIGTTSVTLTADTNDENASAFGDGQATVPDTVIVSVTAEDGSMQDYTIYIRELYSDATLSMLEPNIGTLEPAFHADTLEYVLSVPLGTASIYVTANVSQENATLEGEGTFTDIPGVDTIRVTAEDGTMLEYLIDVQVATSIQNETLTGLKVYPNPVYNELNIDADEVVESIQVFNILGDKILHLYPDVKKTRVTMSSLSPGIYFIHISGKEASSVLRIVKK